MRMNICICLLALVLGCNVTAEANKTPPSTPTTTTTTITTITTAAPPKTKKTEEEENHDKGPTSDENTDHDEGPTSDENKEDKKNPTSPPTAKKGSTSTTSQPAANTEDKKKPTSPTTTSTTSPPAANTDLVVWIVPSFLLVLLIIITVYCAWRCKRRETKEIHHIYDEIRDEGLNPTKRVESSGGPSAEYCLVTFSGGSNQNEPTCCTIPDPPPTGNKTDASLTESPYSMITNPLPDGKTGTPQLNDPTYSLLEKPKVLENNDQYLHSFT